MLDEGQRMEKSGLAEGLTDQQDKFKLALQFSHFRIYGSRVVMQFKHSPRSCEMIRNANLLEKFERGQIRKRKPYYFQNLRIFENLYEEAVHLGILPPKDPLEGIEVDINLAKALNAKRPARKNRSKHSGERRFPRKKGGQP
jgi:hypothetical protein